MDAVALQPKKADKYKTSANRDSRQAAIRLARQPMLRQRNTYASRHAYDIPHLERCVQRD